MFDVAWDRKLRMPMPTGKAEWQHLPDNIEIVPVVYLTNETFQHTTSPTDLADKVSHLLLSYLNNHGVHIKEIQFDCDWSLTTQSGYFSFLQRMKSLHAGVTISSTIRLHQIKFRKETGVPPVDRGMLMFYNMGDLRDPRTKNSIFDALIAKKYTASISSYPLPLDAALPSFSWGVVIRKNKIIELLHDATATDFNNHPYWHKVNDHYYMADSTYLFNSFLFCKGDLLRLESGGKKEALEAAEILAEELPDAQRTISIFSFKGAHQSILDETTLENVYSAFE